MSDPVTNMAIEDVLSSIRRLVSEGDRPARADLFAQPGPKADLASDLPVGHGVAQDVENTDRFVLTPAFRVAEAQTVVPKERAVIAEPAGAEPNAPLPFLRPLRQPADSRSALEMRIAELEAAVTDQADDWEPDGSEDVPVVDWSSRQFGDTLIFSSRAMPHADRSGVLDLGKVGTRIHPVVPDPDPEPETEPDFVAAEPYDLGEDLDLSASQQPEFADQSEVPASDEIGMSEDFAVRLDETGMPDEDALRRLVVDIVRQELQGPMGERITRNVRKMVRREIYRILSSQEFES